MQIRPLLPDLFFQQLEQNDADGIHRSIEGLQDRADGWKHLRAGMRRFTGHHAPRQGDLPAPVLVDALSDLAPTYETGPPEALLDAAAGYLLDLPASPPNVDLFGPTEEEAVSPVVPVSLLEDALTDGSLESTCRSIGRLQRAISSREYFLEVLLDAVAPDATADGRLLVQTNSTVKILHELPWETGRGVVYRLAQALSHRPILPAPAISALPPAVPCRAGYLASLDHEAPEAAWLYLAHAFQAERYAQLRQKGVRWGIRAWIVERLFGGEEARMDREEEALGPRRTRTIEAASPRLPERVGRSIAESIAAGTGDGEKTALEWVERLPDVDPLFRWIADGAVPSLAAGNPRPIVAANAARWGVHLLGPAGGRDMLARLFDRFPALVGTEG